MRTHTPAWRLGGLAALLAAGVLMTDAPEAGACGGCFHGPPTPTQTVTVITDHRMVFSISPTQTVLWDQIEYSGTASAFAWVLPVKPGSRIELSHDAWMAALDASTQTVIQAPQNNCGVSQTQDVNGGGGGGGACGGSTSTAEFAGAGGGDFAEAGSDDGGPPPVTVVTQQVVGPYDSVTVRSSQGEALGAWLRTNGYDVPQSLQPVIDAFTSEGFDFIALRLAPNEGVQAMQPVRVVTPGADLSLPLRMVAAGVGAHVGIELFVLSEGRYHPQNFPDASIDFSKLVWDPVAEVSNYTTLAQQALAANGGRGWLTEMSGPASLYGGGAGGGNPSLASAYGSACSPEVLQPPPGCGAAEAGAPEASTEGGALDDGATEAGEEAGADAAPPPPATDAGADAAACQSQTVLCDDLDLAMNGITPGSLWITRLRADLPAAALSDDLALEAAPSQDVVASFHQTTQYTTANYDPCSGQNAAASAQRPSVAICGCRTIDAAPPPTRDIALLAVAGLGAVLSVRRRRRV